MGDYAPIIGHPLGGPQAKEGTLYRSLLKFLIPPPLLEGDTEL